MKASASFYIYSLLFGFLYGVILLPIPFQILFFLLWAGIGIWYSSFWKEISFFPFLISLFLFSISFQITQFFWIVESLYSHVYSLKLFLFLYFSVVLCITIIFVIITILIHLVFVSLLNYFLKQNNSISRIHFFWMILPISNYIIRFLQTENPFFLIPSMELIENPFLLQLLLPMVQTIGTNASDTLFQGSIFSILSFIFWRNPKNLYLSLFPVSIYGISIVLFYIQNFIIHQKPNGKQLNILSIPWEKDFVNQSKQKNAYQHLLEQTRKKNDSQIDVIIWPENSVFRSIEDGNQLENLQKLLKPHQFLILGSLRREFGNNQFQYYNSAYILNGNEFNFNIYQKKLRVPFGEFIPSWFKYIKSTPLFLDTIEYQKGNSKLMQLLSFKVAIGICYEALFDTWYRNKEKEGAMFYIFLNREFLFSKFGNKVLFYKSQAKAIQLGKDVIRSTNGGYSSVWKNNTIQIINKEYYQKSIQERIQLKNTKTLFFQIPIYFMPSIILLYLIWILYQSFLFTKKTELFKIKM